MAVVLRGALWIVNNIIFDCVKERMNNIMNTDIEWEKWAKQDPYFGVILDEKFRSRNLTQQAKAEFLESGKNDVNHVLAICKRYFDNGFSPKRVLDFGCGVGRLVIPFAEIAEQVVGLDVSESMLEEARKNCSEHFVKNVSLLKSDDGLSSLTGYFDLIHSCIVFQHIPVERGKKIFANLLNHLEEGGIGAIQVTYAKAGFEARNCPTLAKRLIQGMLGKVSQRIRNRGRSMIRAVVRPAPGKYVGRDPEMQMNSYCLNYLYFLVQSAGVRNVQMEFTDHEGFLGIYMYFQKPRNVQQRIS
jgi:2-polyprenyl-3-methyl-5-hydroxy-6-metoxy-1,4-benzoquinol methylase